MRLPLMGGDYQARSVIANGQRCVNLYAEKNPQDSPVPLTYYNAPGLTALGAPPTPGVGRGLYWANNGTLYAAVWNKLYAVSPTWQFTMAGTIGPGNGMVSMADNGTSMVLVDGTANGYQVNLSTGAFSAISAANNSPPAGSGTVYAFYGADRIDMLDGFMLFNYPGTQSFYATYDNQIVFDSTWFAEKNGYSDRLVSLIVVRREIWLLGERTSEIWFNAGGAGLPFQIMPGPFVQHGCSAKYSVAQIDGVLFWLAQDQAGNNTLARGEGYLAKPISTPALVNEWNSYPTTADAIGFCFQMGGHPFYQINFPTANKSWRWDESTGQWHQAMYLDAYGFENRHRANSAAWAYGTNICQDWQTGQIYKIDPNNATDNGMPMEYRRGFPHFVKDGNRVIYPGFTLDAECGTSLGTVSANPPSVALRWSDDRGRTFGNPVYQSLGATGEFLTQAQWSRLGSARDRVFEVYGTVPGRMAINGAWLDPEPISMKS